jgi:integrase
VSSVSYQNKTISVSKGRARRTPPPIVSELNALLRVAAPHIQRVILLGIYTGARIGPSELFSLKWDDVDLTRGVIGIRLVGQILNARHGRESQLKAKPFPAVYDKGQRK